MEDFFLKSTQFNDANGTGTYCGIKCEKFA